ncbi:MAG: exo-beta-N-acetylmuramidase NamZ domain-containing protein, partial [Armatimonadota bacterium]
LFSDVQRPTDDMLQGIEALVFDIQDVGVRYYTYTTTMAWCMEEAAARGIRFVVLDRPNPLGGVGLDGPVLRKPQRRLTTYHRVPVLHGLTSGELALLANAEYGIGAELSVVECEGWRRGMWFDETGLPWVNPSPNLRSLTQATLYPAIAGIEAAAVSVGRGTQQPFEVFGAPYVSGVRLAERLNGAVPHLRFVPVRFTPDAQKFAGEPCEGCFVFTTSREDLRPVEACVEIALALTELHGDHFDITACRHLWGDDETVEAIRACEPRERITARWQDGLSEYETRRRPHLLYS